MNVHVTGVPSSLVDMMFMDRKEYNLVSGLSEADIVFFSRKTDVNPDLYHDVKRLTTMVSDPDDKRDLGTWDLIGGCRDILKVGVDCGAQFLNVMNGGQMFQYCDRHIASHDCVYVNSLGQREQYAVNSTHSQLMRMGGDGILWGYTFQSTYRNRGADQNRPVKREEGPDVEIIWYPDTSSLCFQPHPEYQSSKTTRTLFFDCLERAILYIEDPPAGSVKPPLPTHPHE